MDCRLYSNTSVATSKNLSGGWYDAGDLSKYVNFTWGTLNDLLTAYEENPTVWGDNYNIPESGNGVPDLLDEVKYELDWLLKMQQPDGSVFSIVGHGFGSPPSADVSPARYGPINTSSALTCASIFALAAIQYNSIGMTTYATSLQNASINSWNWAVANPSITWTNSGTGVGAGEQEVDDYGRLMRKLSAASYLYKLTGNVTYKTFFETNYTQAHLLQWSYAYLFETYEQDILLYYSKVPGAAPAVVTAINNAFSNSVATGNTDNYPSFSGQTDAYRAFIRDANYTWGSNSSKGRQGNMFMNMVTYNLDAPNATNYRNAGSRFVHYIHGINPFALVYLSNMNAYGAEKSVKTFYHSWFYDGSPLWDEVGVSTYGPAPGFLPGGPNPGWSLDGCCPSGCGGSNALCVNQLPPSGQPVQKSYKEWNTNWPQNSWSITENGIYYQAAYVKLVSKFADASCIPALPLNIISFQAKRENESINLEWNVNKNNSNAYFVIEKSLDGKSFSSLATLQVIKSDNYEFVDFNEPNNVYYRIKQVDLNGVYFYSSIVFVEKLASSISIVPNPASTSCLLSFGKNNGMLEVYIQDLFGRNVFEYKRDISFSDQSIEILVDKIPIGIYFVTVNIADKIWVERLIKY